jgi:lipopolysaccharide biosynthesis regulator YciM
MPVIPYATELIILIFIILILVVIYYFLKGFKVKESEQNTYIQALELLIDGNYQQAIQKFKETVREDSENIEAYLRLGDLLRERGYTHNALKIHKDLTLRSNLKKASLVRIQRSLIIDYEAVNDFESAINLAKQLLMSGNENIQELTQKLVSFYEKKGKWTEAYDACSKYFKKDLPALNKKMALYLVFQGLDLSKEDKSREARIKFREALKLDSNCAAAYYYLGKSYQYNNRLAEAINQWEKLCEILPSKAHLVFDDLERAWFESGNFSEAEKLYSNLLSNDEANIGAALALAKIYDKKGETERAIKIIDQLDEDARKKVMVQSFYIYALHNNKQYELAASCAVELIKNNDWLEGLNFVCQECHFVSNEPQWICPQCKTIDSFNI